MSAAPASSAGASGTDDRMEVPQGSFALRRHPDRPGTGLLAFDAADRLLLAHLAGEPAPGFEHLATPPVGPATLVLGDAHGALGVGLAGGGPRWASDSASSHGALCRNLERNGRSLDALTVEEPQLVPSTGVHRPDDDAPQIELVVLRPDRSLLALESELRSLVPRLAPDAVVLGASMTRHLHRGALEVLERVVGPTRTSRASRRARLIEAQRDPTIEPGSWDWPRTRALPGTPLRTVQHPGVFAARRPDRGTSLLLEHLPDVPAHAVVVDLGCGDGSLGLRLAHDHPDAAVVLVDDDAAAVASTLAGIEHAGVAIAASMRVVHGNGLQDWSAADGGSIEAGTVDVVVCNPPFHDDHAVGDAIAWQLFNEARLALRPGGELRVVGNRHLAHHAKLHRLFGASEVVASDPRFVVASARRP